MKKKRNDIDIESLMKRELLIKAKDKGKKRRGVRALLLSLLLGILVIFFVLQEREGRKSQLHSLAIEEDFRMTLYFTSAKTPILVGESRRFKEIPSNVLEGAKLALEELIKGPMEEGLILTMPQETKLRELYLAEDVAYPDFSYEFVKNHWGGTSGEIITIYSIVNTLSLNFDEIKKVQILVEGREIPTLAGHLDTSRPISPDLSFISGKKEL
ncbi:TPA: hypothetical protein DCX15_01645 [bacterium]|nr:hypothetical protein [bacterium]